MIQKDYVVQMARYNAWQNNQLRDVLKHLDQAELELDRGAFFGSIFGTLNHILWGDTIWMSRLCSDVAAPKLSGDQSTDCTPTYGVWDAERFRLDGRILIWAQTLSNMDLQGEESWFSGATNQHLTRPRSVCIAHMFNHQTHHRGQISQMLKVIGVTTPVSDLIFMPEDA
ncbi:DinB family protein [uncultured Sulfitobacter sp.]|uniref:DinB family protein n=1 Tax=uncultured Sulfitobacter sp. TaxID=191468 RepID=UPI0026378451|nr:DinB family protein [uncultured Sulfitobacter sp.]